MARTRTLKLYTWLDNDPSISRRSHGQIDAAMVAYSMAEVRRMTGNPSLWQLSLARQVTEAHHALFETPHVAYGRPMDYSRADRSGGEWTVIPRYAAHKARLEAVRAPEWLSEGRTVAFMRPGRLEVEEWTVNSVVDELVTFANGQTVNLLDEARRGGLRVQGKHGGEVVPPDHEIVAAAREGLRRRDERREVDAALAQWRSTGSPASARASAAALIAWAERQEQDGR